MNQLWGTHISYGIIHELNFYLHQGEVVALMGANGAGKSTLARIIAGLIEPTSGEIRLVKSGVETSWFDLKRWQEIGLIGQHPRRQTIGATVAEELGFGLLNLGYGLKEAREIVNELAINIGLGDQLNQSPATLSGGERQRLVMAAVLALKPSFLILDEALTMLDDRSQEACLKLLKAQSEGMGQLWITHDPELARRADRLLVMKKGRLTDMGKPEKALNDSALCKEFSIRQSERLSTLDVQSVELWRKFERALSRRVGVEQSGDTPILLKRGDSVQKPGEVEEGYVLEWKDADYGTRLKITEKIRLKEFIGVLGPSGAGKSTLLDSAIALIRPSAGKFLAFGEEISKQSINQLRQRVRLMLQEPGEYQIGRNVYHEVFYLQSRKERKVNHQANLRYLEIFDISERQANNAQEQLSGGERQRVALAAALESLPEVLLLDEPLLGLDAEGRALFQSILKELKGRLIIVYVTHDLSEVVGLADRLWLIDEGRLTLDCPGKDWPMYMNQFKKAGVRFPVSGV